jgi:hypothetical protein
MSRRERLELAIETTRIDSILPRSIADQCESPLRDSTLAAKAISARSPAR